MITYYAKKNQTGTPITGTLTDGKGALIDLTGVGVNFVMWNLYTGAEKINAPATIANQTTNKGEVSYEWAEDDFDTPGYYLAEWRADIKTAFPTDYLPDAYIKVIVGEFEADSYISTLQLMSGASAPEASDEQIWTDYAVGASRLFDRLCEVEAGFFNQALPVTEESDGKTEKTFYGNGIDIMELPPFVGSIVAADVLIDDKEIETEDIRIKNGFIYRLRDYDFDSDSVIKITARWGFASVPADVQMIVRELAVYLWRNRDPHFARISETGVYEDLAPTIKTTIKKFRERYSQMGAV